MSVSLVWASVECTELQQASKQASTTSSAHSDDRAVNPIVSEVDSLEQEHAPDVSPGRRSLVGKNGIWQNLI